MWKPILVGFAIGAVAGFIMGGQPAGGKVDQLLAKAGFNR